MPQHFLLNCFTWINIDACTYNVYGLITLELSDHSNLLLTTCMEQHFHRVYPKEWIYPWRL